VNRIPERNRPLVVLGTAAVAMLIVAGSVLLLGRIGPTPTPTVSPSPPLTSSPSTDASTPEGAVRAMFEAFGRARPTNDPSLVLPFVTSEQSPAYLSVSGFLEGQRGLQQAAVITDQDFEEMSIERGDGTATVTFTYVETGYLIDIDSGEPLASPDATEPTTVVARVVLRGSTWLVEEYEST
jgi:hypothetical protein